nr:retrovirus-related Pol polyprotein from transposon TNT 1-94 [Tanacetum cinerariifolium]
MMTDWYCPRSEIKKLEIEIWNVKVKGTDVVSYTQRFQELARICGRMFPEESDEVDNKKKEYVGTLPLFNKCKFHHNGSCTVKCANCKRVGHLTQDCKSPAATNNQRTLICYECGNQGRYRSDCPELKNQNHENQARGTEARGFIEDHRRRNVGKDIFHFPCIQHAIATAIACWMHGKWKRGFEKYYDLISCLLVSEQNNELLMKNHETRATGTALFPEANVATFNNQNGSRGRVRGSDRGRSHGFGRGIYHGVQFKDTSGHNETSWEITKAIEYLKKEFEMKDLGETKFCLGLQIEYLVGFVVIFRYLYGTKDMGLYYTNSSQRNLVGFADAGYMSDPHTGRSQTGYIFTSSNNSISWRSVKQTMSATSSNHVEILAIHEASRECMIQHICESCGISSGYETPTVLHEDNAACIAK